MALFEAIEAGSRGNVRSVLEADPSRAGSRSATGVSAILWALYRNHHDIVEALLEVGPALDVFDAAALGRLDRLTELVDADPEQANAWSADGFTPVGLAAFFGQPEAVRLLIERGADVHAVARNEMRVQPLHAATAASDVESVRMILEAGADPNAEQQKGFTPLMAARLHDDQAIIDLLLAHGAQDPEAHDAPVHDAPVHDAPVRAGQADEASGNRSTTS
ncbi:MAG TPA: ankyrin repeat domain-containing protein [Acidimicrobiales bacterium]|nr:ankyrin repeat domain-containing protein [Acidimicrobiales bacterium]